MAMENKRITQLSTERLTLTSGDYVMVDDADNGSAKYRLDRLKETDTTLSVSGKAADAAATGQAISDEAKARDNADNALGEDISDLKSAMDSAESSIESLEGTKADVDGTYEDMTVGTAEAVLSESYTADSVPYHFRKTPYGDRLKEKIIGGTVAWNQLCESSYPISQTVNGVTFTNNQDGSITANGTATADAYEATSFNLVAGRQLGHIYYIGGCPNGGSASTYWFGGRHLMNDNNQHDFGNGVIAKDLNGAQYSSTFSICIKSGTTVNNLVFKPQVFDLTVMFNTAIADYIYSLEQTTAGAGVALFRELFPKDYYEYDAGSLQSVSGLQSHDEVGFNQWDEIVESGYINLDTGVNMPDANKIRAKNYIPVLPDTLYYKKTPVSFWNAYYDADKNYLGYANPSQGEFRTPSNAHFMRFACETNYGTTYNHDICINLSDPSKNGQYEPYKKHSYALDSSLTLRGIPKLDANNNLYYDGDVYESDGKVTRRYGIVDLGTLNWQYDSEKQFFLVMFSARKGGTNFICSKYPNGGARPDSQMSDATDKQIYSNSVIGAWFSVKDSSYTDAATFKTAMSGVMLVYELATPTEESAQPFVNPQRCAEGGTEEYVTTGIVPVGHESEYYENIATKVDGLPYDLSMIAPIENGTTASKAYSTGQYFLHNDQFCKAKTAIASGATFTLNTNYEVTTVANELYTALH